MGFPPDVFQKNTDMQKRIMALAAALCACVLSLAYERPLGLRCERQLSKALTDSPSPRLSWVANTNQTAYQVIVSKSRPRLDRNVGDAWDSGKVPSNESLFVPYEGAELEAMTDYYWKVRVWDENDVASEWSDVGAWTTGMLDDSDWKAMWIGAPWQEDERGKWYTTSPMFRKEFTVEKGIKEAKAFICGLGWFEMSLNGRKVGQEYFSPGFTDYTARPYLAEHPRIPLDPAVTAHRTLYVCHDISRDLKIGRNAVGVLLGNGYFHSNPGSQKNENYGVPRLICQIELLYENGRREVIVSDESWKAKESPIVFNDLYEGEIFDASKAIAGWDRPGLDDSSWENAVPRKAPDGKLTASAGPADKVTERLAPVKLERVGEKSWKVDFGKEISGWIRFSRIRANEGDTLKVKYLSESPNGRYEYVFSGGAPVWTAPKFTWFAFREAEISGVRNLSEDNIMAEVIHSDVPVNSEFSCSNTLFMKVNEIWRRSQMNNMHCGVASDCPHRERLPYTGDGQVAMAITLANFDAQAFYGKWLDDIRGSQNPKTGYVPNGAPWEPYCGGGPAWGAAICVMPWEYYKWYGDRKALAENLDAMKAFSSYLMSWRTEEGVISVNMKTPDGKEMYWYNLGDWAPSYKNPDESLVHTFYAWLCLDITSKAAEALGDEKTAFDYALMAANVRSAFHQVFYDASAKSYGDFGSDVYALYMGVPKDRHEDVRTSLREQLETKYGRHLNTGMLATRFLFETLSENGLGDLAYDIMNQRDFPSFGHWIEQGATTTWEQWDGGNSHDHPMFGGGLTWFHKTLAGVDTDPAEPGFRHVIIKPIPTAKLNMARYVTMTPYGELASEVSHDGEKVSVKVRIPEGSHATVYVPKSVEAMSRPFSEDNYTIHEVGAGSFSF